MVTCCENADLLVYLRVVFSCVFVTFPIGVLGHVGNLIVLIPDFDFHFTMAETLFTVA